MTHPRLNTCAGLTIVICFAKVTLRDVNDDEKPSDFGPQQPIEILENPAASAPDPDLAPVFTRPAEPTHCDFRRQLAEACGAWLTRSPSVETRLGYARDLAHFFRFNSIPDGAWERLADVRPTQVAAWRDELLGRGYTNASTLR